MVLPCAEHKKGACLVCAQPARMTCPCGTRYCSKACQSVDWKDRGHKSICKRRFSRVCRGPARRRGTPRLGLATARAARGGAPPAPAKAAPPLVAGPARGDNGVRVQRAAAEAAAPGARAPDASARCPVCLEDWARAGVCPRSDARDAAPAGRKRQCNVPRLLLLRHLQAVRVADGRRRVSALPDADPQIGRGVPRDAAAARRERPPVGDPAARLQLRERRARPRAVAQEGRAALPARRSPRRRRGDGQPRRPPRARPRRPA